VVFPTGGPFQLGGDKWQLRLPESLNGSDEDLSEEDFSDEETDEASERAAEVQGSESSPVLHVGPGGIEDPDTEWDFGDSADPLPELDEGEYLLLLPGEDVVVVDNLPRPRRSDVAVIFRDGEIALSDGKHRYWMRTPGPEQEVEGGLDVDSDGGEDAEEDEPAVSRLVVVFVAHRAVRRTNRPRRYLAALDADDNLLGWLDYSDTWPLRTDRLEQMATLGGVRLETERYVTETEFERAHPDWVG
jgi:hypothetical protein